MAVTAAIGLSLSIAPLFLVQGPTPCPEMLLIEQLSRAEEARDDLFFWEGIDDAEALVDLGRYIHRLERLLSNVPEQCGGDVAAAEILDRAARLLKHARTIPHPPRWGPPR